MAQARLPATTTATTNDRAGSRTIVAQKNTTATLAARAAPRRASRTCGTPHRPARGSVTAPIPTGTAHLSSTCATTATTAALVGARVTAPATPAPLKGILFALGGALVLSVNDVAIKSLSGDYALHQVILTRAFISMALILAVIAVSGTGFRQLLTHRPKEHLFRVSIVMVSNVTYFLGLAALPLADAVATAFVAPILVTLLSSLVLHEQVGPRRFGDLGRACLR